MSMNCSPVAAKISSLRHDLKGSLDHPAIAVVAIATQPARQPGPAHRATRSRRPRYRPPPRRCGYAAGCLAQPPLDLSPQAKEVPLQRILHPHDLVLEPVNRLEPEAASLKNACNHATTGGPEIDGKMNGGIGVHDGDRNGESVETAGLLAKSVKKRVPSPS